MKTSQVEKGHWDKFRNSILLFSLTPRPKQAVNLCSSGLNPQTSAVRQSLTHKEQRNVATWESAIVAGKSCCWDYTRNVKKETEKKQKQKQIPYTAKKHFLVDWTRMVNCRILISVNLIYWITFTGNEEPLLNKTQMSKKQNIAKLLTPL